MSYIDSIAVIVTYNRLDSLKEAVINTILQPFSSIIVVNNASTDDTQIWLDSLVDKRLIILSNTENCGGSGGFYTALEWLSKNAVDEDPWVVLYDDDSFPNDGFLTSLSKISSRYSSRKLFCSLVLDSNRNPVVMNTPIINNPEYLFDTIKSLMIRKSYALTDFSRPTDVKSCSFVGFIARKSLLVSKLELFPRNFFIYFDDVFYTNILSQCNGSILFHPELVFTHRVNFRKAHSIQPVWKTYFYVRNMFAFYRSYCPRWYLVQVIPRLLSVLLMALKDSDNRSKILRHFSRGLYDGFKSNFDNNPLKAK